MNKILSGLIATVILACGCSSTFLVSKNGKGYFISSSSSAAYKMLCDSGDLKKVLLDTTFSEDLKNNILNYTCSIERSGDKVKQVYVSMTAEQRKELRSAFRKNGYDINSLPC